MKIYVNNRDQLDNFLEDGKRDIESRNDISIDTKAICYWLYIIAKTIVAIFAK